MATLREDRNEDLLDNDEGVELEKVQRGGTLYYIDGKNNVYNNKSFLQKFEKCLVSKLKLKMSTQLKETTHAFIGSIVGIIFSEFEGKKVGEEFSLDECVEKMMANFNIEEVEGGGGDGAGSENSKPVKKKKEDKVKKPRKKSGYNIFISDNKEMLNEKIAEILKETGEKKTPPSVAGPLWKALSDEEKKVYNDKAAAQE